MTLTQIAVVSALGYVTYQWFWPSRLPITPEDVLMQNPTMIPSGTIPSFMNTPERRKEVEAGIVKFNWDLTHGQLRGPNGKLSGVQYY